MINLPTKTGWYRARWPVCQDWSCVLVERRHGRLVVCHHGDEIDLENVAEWGLSIDDLMERRRIAEAEIAILHAFVSEVADLLGCEADEPGALESIIVEMSAMRDRDADGAKEIASLRAEVERLTAERDACRRILDAALALGEDALP